MAVLNFKFGKGLKRPLEYVTNDRGENDEFHAQGCSKETAFEEFAAVRELHKKNRANSTLTLMQSWSHENSQKKTPKEFLEIGRKLTEELFPGHQYVIRTHTDTDNIHNHIVINTVHPETGKVIQNKKYWPDTQRRFVDHLRDVSNRICLEHGLTIIDKGAYDRDKTKPYKVQKMDRFQKDAWVSSLSQKAELARGFSTSYKEYVSILGEFDIQVRVENKNISYLYPGQTRAKRGSKLGSKFDKAKLEKKFEENDKLFLSKPEIRSRIRGELNSFPKSSSQVLRDVNGIVLELNESGEWSKKNYPKFEKHKRGEKVQRHLADKEFEGSMMPRGEISKAKRNIFDYCKLNNIDLKKNDKGETVLRGREHVILGDFEWENRLSHERGSLIEFVSCYHKTSLLRAIAHINGNDRLLLLEGLSPQKQFFSSLYIPKQEQLDFQKSTSLVGSLLNHFGADPQMGNQLINKSKAQVNLKGMIRIFTDKDATGAFEFTQGEDKKWQKSKRGEFHSPFYSQPTKGKELVLFLDPFSIMNTKAKDFFLGKSNGKGVLALMEPNEDLVFQYLGENKAISHISIVRGPPHDQSKHDLDIFNVLNTRLAHHQITVNEISLDHLGIERGHGMDR